MTISFFLSRITMVVVSTRFPKSFSVFFGKLNAHSPLSAFPEIKSGDDKPYRVAVLWGKHFIITFNGKQDVRFEEIV